MDSSMTVGLHVVDYVVFAAFLVISTGIGLFFAFRGGRQRTTSEFLMANRNLKTLPVAISIVVSFISGILFLGHPAEMYTRGTQFSMRMFGYALASVLASVLFVPLFFRLKVVSSFEYLEARYKSKGVKLVGSVTSLICMLMQMGIVLYAPAVALQAVNGIPLWISIVLTCSVATIYTTLGGMKAVIYTDVFQAFCMVAGMTVIVIQGTIKVGSIGKVWELNARDGRIDFFNMDPDPTVRASFWSTVFGAMCFSLSVFGVGQTTVQRYCALPTLRQAKCSVYLNGLFVVILFSLVTVVGLVIYAFYASIGCDPLRAKHISSANQLVPYFVSSVLNYPGLSGAYLAVLFGGALSTLSSSLNSAAAILWQDVLKYFFEQLPETRKAIVTKTFVLLFGAAGVGIAFLAKFMGGHVLQAFTTVLGTFVGPTLGLFMLGVLFPFANSKGAVVGCLLSTSFSVWIAVGAFVYAPHRTTLPTSIENCSSSSSSNRSDTTALPDWNANFSSGFQNDGLAFGMTESSTDEFLESWTTPFSNSNSNSSSDNTFPYPLVYLYSISFNLYPIIGLANTLIIGIIVSILTGGCSGGKVDPNLLVPVFDRFCCFLPLSVRRRLRCGVEYNDNDDNNNNGDDNGGGDGDDDDDGHVQTDGHSSGKLSHVVVDRTNENASICCFWNKDDEFCDKENLKSKMSTGFLSKKPTNSSSPSSSSSSSAIELRFLRQIKDADL